MLGPRRSNCWEIRFETNVSSSPTALQRSIACRPVIRSRMSALVVEMNTATSCPAIEPGQIPADSSVCQTASSMSRCWGSIQAAICGAMPNRAGSNRSRSSRQDRTGAAARAGSAT